MASFIELIHPICPNETELLNIKEQHVCPVDGCGKILKKYPNLQMHLVKHHKIGSMGTRSRDAVLQFLCPAAGCKYGPSANGSCLSFSARRLLQQHYSKVHAPKRFACARCGLRSSLRSALRRHVAVCNPAATTSAAISNRPPSDHNYAALSNTQIDQCTQTSLKVVEKSKLSKSTKYNVQTQTLQILQKDKKAKLPIAANLKIKKEDTTTDTCENSPINKLNTIHFDDKSTVLSIVEKNEFSDYDKNLDKLIYSHKMQSTDIETQTALDELLYCDVPQSNDPMLNNHAFPDSITLSDIQTQTTVSLNSSSDWDDIFSEINDNVSKYDQTYISADTQTDERYLSNDSNFSFGDSESGSKHYLCNSLFISTETQTIGDFRDLEDSHSCGSNARISPLNDFNFSNCFKETQTCCCSFESDVKLKDSHSSNPWKGKFSLSDGNSANLPSTQTDASVGGSCLSLALEYQTNPKLDNVTFLNRKSDFLLSCASTETQTCFENC